jgi:hypothetical protein
VSIARRYLNESLQGFVYPSGGFSFIGYLGKITTLVLNPLEKGGKS